MKYLELQPNDHKFYFFIIGKLQMIAFKFYNAKNLKRFDFEYLQYLINFQMTEHPGPGQNDLKFDNMTREDLKKIEKSMKRPEFMGLLNEYMIQISDPKNKIEYDQYLRQMESEKQLPKHMKIVELTPKFCFRTFIVSQKNKKHEMKFFINMCETIYLEEPSSERVPDNQGKIGESWKIPNSSGKIRYDQDKKGAPCQVIDVAFHPKVFQYAFHKRFQEMIINIALEAAEKQLGERKETLSRDYVILKNVICKGQDGKPALMPIRYIEGKVYNKGEGPTSQPERDNEGRQTKLQREINKQKQEHDQLKKKKPQTKQEQQEKQQEIQDKKLIVDMSEGVQRPKYSTIFTYPIDYSEFMDNPAINNRKKVPSVFNIEFSIPRVQSLSEIADQKLQINDKQIILKIGDKYFIDLELSQFKLKYVLQPTLAKAKYDKKKKCLRIVIPIDQTINYFPQENDSAAEKSKQKDGQQNNIVQSQTWKNKVLDFSEPNVSVQILNPDQPVEQAPKLVEEIEEEDEITEKPTVKAERLEDQDQGEEIKKKQEKFSVSNYYKKTQQNEESRRLKYLFQETPEQILLVFKIKSYKKEDLFSVTKDKKQFLLEWRQPGKVAKFAHYKLKDEFSDKSSKVEVILRVGFILFSITKSEKGKFWQKESIEEISYLDQDEEVNYQNFKKTFDTIQQSQREVAIVEPPKKSIQSVRSQKVQEQVVAPVSQNQSHAELAQDTKQEEPKRIEQQVKKQRINAFQNLQAQFISFNAPFIDALD